MKNPFRHYPSGGHIVVRRPRLRVDKKHIVQVMGYATAGLSVSQMAGVPIDGYLAGISWRAPFITISAASLVLLLLINFCMPKLEIGT